MISLLVSTGTSQRPEPANLVGTSRSLELKFETGQSLAWDIDGELVCQAILYLERQIAAGKSPLKLDGASAKGLHAKHLKYVYSDDAIAIIFHQRPAGANVLTIFDVREEKITRLICKILDQS